MGLIAAPIRSNNAHYHSTTTLTRNPASQIASLTRSNDAYAWTGGADADTSYTANGLNQYSAVAGTGLGYDPNGNLTFDGPNRYLYDIENRLVSRSGEGTSASLRYDPLGRLYEVTGSGAGTGGTTRFLYDGDALVAEYDAAGTLLRRYVHGDGAGADDPLVWFEGASTADSARRYLFTDERGSVVAITDADGNGFAINAYDEHGIPAAGNLGRFQYTGQIWLAELGLYHYKARVYSPYLGRFLQTDPIGYDDGLNIYAYVGNDPVNGVDPDGEALETLWDAANVAAGIASAVSNARDGNWGAAAVDVGGVLVDAAATVAPAIPGGVAAGLKIVREGGDAARAAQRPSTLRPGPHAKQSIPAQPGRPSAAEQREINRMGRKDGCHTCGTRDSGRQSGNWTGDHQPANALNHNGGPQRFYSQCEGCSARQGAEVRNALRDKRPPPPPPPRRRLGD